eukprot:TRINITY_DN287_c0_g1_i1.p1 TRINITY_DN287_c0_g1~~TRINITY_DN287_c0_g1_i1.p1  ORF type:complete len:190 (+),score=43.37 TRINITY_DN287_c0_g1_i1:290-859(+)
MSLYAVKSIVILGHEGMRICSKYFGKEIPFQAQRDWEKKIFEKTQNQTGEILLLDSDIIVYRNISDVYFYVSGSANENELLLDGVLTALVDTLTTSLRDIPIDQRVLLEHLDLVLLALDELLDNGIILESDAKTIESRMVLGASEEGLAALPKALPLSDQQQQQLQRALNRVGQDIAGQIKQLTVNLKG